MPSRVVVQPNGFYALFSTVVDHFTAYNMTREEAVKEAGEEKVKRGEEFKCCRWDEAIGDIHFRHGEKDAITTKNFLTLPPT